MRVLFSKEKIGAGLDIGTSAVKLVKLKLTKGGFELCGYASEAFSGNPEPVLKKILPAQEVKAISLSFSGPSTIIRYINFPRMKAQELRQALKFEVQKQIPFSVDEVNLDGCILKEDLAGNKMLVLVAAVKKELVNSRLKLMQDLGIKVIGVSLDSLALINAFSFNYSDDETLKNKTVALLNIESTLVNLNILEGNTPRFSRDIVTGTSSFLTDPPANREEIFTNLAAEIRTSFDYYEAQSVSSVAKIFLSGSGAGFPGLKDKLAGILGIEIISWDSLRKLVINANPDAQKIKAAAGELAVAVGLALTALNHD